MGNFGRDDRSGGGYRGGFSGGRDRGGFGRGRSSFGGGRGGDRPMFTATCSNCGKECQVPFRPTNGKPVYCSDCFEKMGGRNDNRSDSRGGDRPRFEDRKPAFDQSKAQLDAINAKLDRILSVLEPKTATVVVAAGTLKEDVKPEVKAVKEEKVVKAKKVTKKVASEKKE